MDISYDYSYYGNNHPCVVVWVSKRKRVRLNTDVVVVGAGVIGCSVAYYLAKKGAKVMVIEKREGLCYGASGSNQGGCPVQLFDSPVLELAQASVKLYKNLSEEINYNIEFEQRGTLLCVVCEEQYAHLEKHAQNMRKKGVNIRLIEGNKIRELEPALSQNIIAGTEEQDGGTVNPFKVTYGFMRAAKKLGAEFLFSTEIKQIEVIKGSIASVVTDRGKIKTSFVVNAAGVWSAEIGKKLGLNIPICPRRGQIIVTEPVSLTKRWRYIIDADYITTAFDIEAVAKSKDPRIKLGVAGSYTQGNTGNWTIGSSRDFAGYDNQVTAQTVKYMAKRAILFMPNLRNVNCIRMFAGLRPFCYADGLPIVSKVNKPSGFIIATGHAGEGVALSPITGKLITELITENKTSLPLDAFAFSRFKHMNQI